jgi:hypothetical protein
MTIPVKYVVMNENTLGYIFDTQPKTMGVLAGSVIKGGHDWKNGPVPIRDSDSIRPATKADFDVFRVDAKGHIPTEQGEK